MAIENLDQIIISAEEKEGIRKKLSFFFAFKSNLHKVGLHKKLEKKLYRAICSESGGLKDNLLDVVGG